MYKRPISNLTLYINTIDYGPCQKKNLSNLKLNSSFFSSASSTQPRWASTFTIFITSTVPTTWWIATYPSCKSKKGKYKTYNWDCNDKITHLSQFHHLYESLFINIKTNTYEVNLFSIWILFYKFMCYKSYQKPLRKGQERFKSDNNR